MATVTITKDMDIKELETALLLLNTEQLLNVLDYFARDGLGYKYCTVRAEVYRRLEGKKNDD